MKISFRDERQKSKWHSWFAWHPVRIRNDNSEVIAWVFLQKVERQFYRLEYWHDPDTFHYRYRFPVVETKIPF